MPRVQEKKLRRLIGTGAAILFKGAGFYQTDYRSDSYKSAATADEKAGTNGTPAAAKTTDAAGKSGGETKADAAPAPKKAKS